MSPESNQESCRWNAAPAIPVFEDNDVHVWRAHLDDTVDPAWELGLLSEDERRRAARFRFAHHRTRFVLRRALLRTILGRYVGIEPGRLQFRDAANGKLALTGYEDLQFNLSSSRSVALYAIACDRVVGVDVEHVSPSAGNLPLAERLFASAELTALRSLPASSRGLAFYRCWTRKEAFVKAIGSGLSRSLDTFEVPLDAADRLMPVHSTIDPDVWSVREVMPAPAYVGAVASEGQNWTASYFEAPPANEQRTAIAAVS